MLYLSREINQVVKVGDDIEIKVMAVNGQKVLLGFKAPKKVTVHREEVYKRNQLIQRINDGFYLTGGK
jgi:carbon storage regulator